MFYEALNENKNNQLIFPYLSYCAAKENKLDNAKYFLTYPFSNYLITDLRQFEQKLSKDSWEDLSVILSELELLGSFVELILDYMCSEDDDKINVLNEFKPSYTLERFWHNAFYLNTYNLASLAKTIFPDKPYRNFKQNFEECIRINPTCAFPHYMKYFMDPMPIIANLDKAIELKPDYFDALQERAWLYFDDNDFLDCIADCDQVLYYSSANKLVKWALWQKGWSLVMLERYQDAIICYNQNINIDPNDRGTYLYRGSAKNRMGDLTGALSDYLKFVEHQIEDKVAIELIVIGNIYLKLKQFNEAIKYYTKAIEIDNKISAAYFRRASAFKEIKQDMLSESDIKSANNLIISKQNR